MRILFGPMHTTKKTITAAFAAVVLSLATVSGRAQVFTETGDAGDTLATFATTGSSGALTEIDGTIFGGSDVDLFVISITDTSLFSASTVNATTTIDTQLYLFTLSGTAVVGNDDASALSFQSTIPAGSLSLLSPGTYILAISLAGNNPINASSQLLFTGYGADTTAILTGATGVNPTTLSGFDGFTYFDEAGSYSISLTGAAVSAVPEMSTTALGFGLVTLAGSLWLRRRQTPVG
jgi:hypothetical protein